MATIREIAAASGFSKTTVWSVLRGTRKIAEETRKKILATADELGYRPNPAYQQMCQQIRARQKVTYRSTLAIIHGFPNPHPENSNPFHHDFCEGLEEEAHRLGFEIDYFWENMEGLRGARLSEIIWSRGIEGLIICASDDHRTLDLDWNRFASVGVGFTVLGVEINRVEADYQQATMICLKQLLDHGYKQIGFVLRSDYEVWRRYNLSAPYCWYQTDQSVESRPPVFISDNSKREQFLRWMDTYKFDSLITNHVDVIDWCRAAGIRIPEDLGVTLATPTPLARFGNVSGIDYHPRRLGTAALTVLVAQMHRREIGLPRNPKVVTTNVTWKDGQTIRSVGPANDSFRLGFPHPYIADASVFSPELDADKD